MNTSILRAPSSVNRLINRMQLLPLVESCETVWPSKLDIQLILPTYKADLRDLQSTLEVDSSHWFRETDDKDILNFQVAFASICYESTAFIISEELAAELQPIKDLYIWSKLMHLSTRKMMISLMFKQYSKTLLGEDWHYNFGTLSSFWGFVWDLLDFDRDMNVIDRNVVEVIELVSFRLLQSKSIPLFVKGITILEECIHKTRGYSLMDYETVYKELLKHTWRLSSKDERNQQASIILLAAMLECVRTLEVERNQLLTLIQNFTQPSRADNLMDILLKGLKESCTMNKSIGLLDILLQLLSIDHANIRVISEELLDGFNNNGPNNADSGANDSLVLIKDAVKINSADWWQDIIVHNISRFHRWTSKLLRLLVSEIDKFEKFNALHYQYLACAMFFLIRPRELDTVEKFEGILKLMVTFVEKIINRLTSLIASADGITYSSLKICNLLVKANVACLRSRATLVHKACSSGMMASTINKEFQQSQQLNKMMVRINRW